MHIGILGTGIVGQTLGLRLVQLGHPVMLGTRDPSQLLAGPVEWLFWLSFSAFGVVLLSPRSLLQERPADMAVARDASPADR